MTIPPFPKIFALGTQPIKNLLHGVVEVTEKIDGSQFSFGIVNGKLLMRSKGAQIDTKTADKLFKPVVEWVCGLENIPAGLVFHGETLCNPKHNVLKYERVPENHFALFGVREFASAGYDNMLPWNDMFDLAAKIDCDIVPRFCEDHIKDIEEFKSLLDKESFLGGTKIEGVVIKRYMPTSIGNEVFPIMAGKYVSETFKEVHQSKTYGAKNDKDKMAELFERYRTEARWRKAVQHLREKNLLENTPKDISALLKEINTDTEAECSEEVAQALYEIHRKQFLRTLTEGFAEWYKMKLASQAFEE